MKVGIKSKRVLQILARTCLSDSIFDKSYCILVHFSYFKCTKMVRLNQLKLVYYFHRLDCSFWSKISVVDQFLSWCQTKKSGNENFSSKYFLSGSFWLEINQEPICSTKKNNQVNEFTKRNIFYAIGFIFWKILQQWCTRFGIKLDKSKFLAYKMTKKFVKDGHTLTTGWDHIIMWINPYIAYISRTEWARLISIFLHA